MPPKHWLADILKGKGTPVLDLLDSVQAEFLSAANLFNLIRLEAKSLDVWNICPMDSINGLVRFLACLYADRFAVVLNDRNCDQNDIATRYGRLFQNNSSGAIFLTSGTSTGTPKAVLLEWPKIVMQVDAHAGHLKYLEGSSRYSLLPKAHGFGLIIDLLVGLKLKQTIHLTFLPSTRLRTLSSDLSELEIDSVCLTPRLLEVLKTSHFEAKKSQSLTVHVGGAPLPDSLRSATENRGLRVLEGYGFTEAGPGVLMEGLPIGCEVELQEFESGSPYQLLAVRTPTLGIAEHIQVDTRGFYLTEDLAIQDAKGVYKVVGRKSQFVKKSDGTWTSIHSIKAKVKQRFGLKEIEMSNQSGTLMVGVSKDQLRTVSAALIHFLHLNMNYPQDLIAVVHSDSICFRQDQKSARGDSYV